MNVVIASTRTPKVNGVQRAFRKFAHLYPLGHVSFESVSVESGVQATPLSIDELLNGAQRRAQNAFAAVHHKLDAGAALYAVGVEGGLSIFRQHVFLQSWACVFDGKRFSFGSSGSIEIPEALSTAVVRDREDLGRVIDLFAEQHDVRSNQGTWGILTNALITREESFELATLNALAPFFNATMYQREMPGAN